MHRLWIAVAVAAAGVLPSYACDLCAVYNASAARGENSPGFHLTIAQQFTHSGTLQEEGEKISNPGDQYRDSSITSLLLGRNFNSTFGVTLNVPYIHRTFRRLEGGVVETGTESGLGDIALLARFIPFRVFEHDYSISLSLLGGIEFPTGDSGRLREEVNEVEVPGAPTSGVHGNDLALGSGSFDGVVGTTAMGRWKRLFMSVDAQYFIRTRGDFGYRFGNELAVSGGPGAYLLFHEGMTLAMQANFTYESKARDRVAGEKRNDGITTSWYGGPGIVFTFGEHFSASVNADLPLRIYNRRVQSVPDYRLRGGVTWAF
jgi:hypothetical protein